MNVFDAISLSSLPPEEDSISPTLTALGIDRHHISMKRRIVNDLDLEQAECAREEFAIRARLDQHCVPWPGIGGTDFVQSNDVTGFCVAARRDNQVDHVKIACGGR